MFNKFERETEVLLKGMAAAARSVFFVMCLLVQS